MLLSAGRLIEEPSNLELLVREDVALQQLVLASMGTNPLVVQQAVKIMSAVGAYAGAAKRLVKHNVVRAITGMLASGDKVSRLASEVRAQGAVDGPPLIMSEQRLHGRDNHCVCASNSCVFYMCVCADVSRALLCRGACPAVPAVVRPACAVQAGSRGC